MILKRFSVFYVLLLLCFGASVSHGQASLQRGVRISNANGNIVSILTGGTTQTYSLTLPLTSNPSLTTASLLFGFGTGNLGWTDPTGATNGSILVLQNVGGNLTPTWTDPLSLNYWSLDGNAITTAWNGAAGNFIGTTSAQPLVIATTNTATPQPIEFYTNNAEKMRLSAGGNLGIGQTNPSELLEVGSSGNILLSNSSGTAGQLQLQGTGSGLTTLQAGAQGAANINYTWPLALPPVGGYVLAASTTGVMSWVDPSSVSSSAWQLLGNAGTTAWNGTTGNFLGTVDAQPTVIATTSTAAPQPIEFFTNTTEKVRISATGNVGINQTNPSQLLEVKSGNFLLSNTGTADQLQFQGTGSGITTFEAGAQGATNINYTLPTAAAAANGYVLSSTTGGTMSWIDPTTLPTNDWHIIGNSGTTAWNGAAGNFLGTTDAQPLVVATTNTATPQPIEFYTNNAEKMRLSATGNLGLNQTNPSQLLELRSGNLLLSNAGTADQLQFQGTSSGVTTFEAGAQGATNINYTLPTAAAAANGYVLSSTTGGTMSWIDPTTIATNDWHLLGNAGTSAWNGATGNFVGTTDAQPIVIATTNTATPQPIEFFTNTTEKVRISATGNLGINQTNPSQLLEVKNGNFLLSNSGTADQLQFQGTSSGITTFEAGAQGATNINYTLPTAAAAANGYVLSSTTGGVMSWTDPTTLASNDWHLLGNAGTTAWNGATGDFVGTTDAQPLVVATTNTATPQPIEFFTNTTEKMRLSASGNLGLNQTNPSQLLELKSGNLLLSNAGSADQLQFQGTGSGITTFEAGAQGATNINYILPTAAAAANGYVLSSTTGGVMSWIDPSAIPMNDWHLLGNAGTSAWNGATGNFLGTTDAQPTVIATTNTATPQPIEFFTNTTEKARISATGNFGINQTNPSQLLEVANGNFLLSNTGSADQLQFQGTSTGITTFQAGTQGATNINYTLPTAAAAANGYVLSSTTGGAMSWIDPSTIPTNDWHLLGNAGTTAWNGATGDFVGTTDAQPLVVATTNTATPQPIEFYTNTTEKMRLSASGNLGLNQTNPSQLLELRSGNLLLSNAGSADQLQFQGTSSGITTFEAGAQGATNINYTLPTAAAAANGYVLSSTTGGVMSWIDPSTIPTNDWHLLGNAGTSAWNGATGNFLGTTDAQPTVIATTNTATPQPIEFFTNTTEKARISATGNLGINQTNPSQLLEVKNGNFLLSNSGSADQLQFQGTSSGITTFEAGAQGATNINYTLPTVAAAANGYVLSSTTGGVMSWIDPTTIATNDWHLLGNSATTAWNGATGNFVGTTDAQPIVIATTNTATPQPIEFYTNTTEKMRLSAAGNLGLNQTNPSQLLELKSGNLLLSNAGTADQLQFQGTGSGITTFEAGAQGATNINYTLPTAAAAANGYVLSSTTGGIMSWIDPTTLSSSDWHLLGNAGTSAWNGATGNFLGTTDAQPTVIATTNTATPQPIEFFTNTTEKARISATGNFGINQTNPSQLLEVANGNFLLSNTGSADQLQFQGTSTGITSFQAGAQGATNINYTLPTAAAAANGYVLSSTTGGVMSWIDPATLASSDWHLLGNSATTAWNGATGNFVGTTDAQPIVIATTNTATPQPIEFFTNTTEKARISATGNFGINQTNPSQLIEVANGNFLLSNTGTADQLQFQGTSTGITTFQAGAQGATNINYTLPTAAAAANGYVLSSTTGGAMSWIDPATLASSDWHLLGNSATTAWNGTTGNFVGTTDAQPIVIATTNTATPQPIEFYTNTTEKMRLSAAGNLGLNQTNPSQLLELKSGNLLLSNAGTADQLQFQGTGSGITTFEAGAQGATNINYTLPTAAAAANGYVLSSTTGGVMSWIDPTTLSSSDWHLLGNAGTSAWNGATGNFLGTTDAQPTVIATTNTATPQPIEFFTNTTEKARISAAGNFGINQTNPSQLLEVKNGNFLLSNSGSADQLQFQGMSTGITTFEAGAQGATNINYTLPTAAAAANGYVLSSTTGGVMSWVDPTTVSNDWHLTGNTGTTAWNGAAGNIIGTLDAQDFVIGTGAVAGTREKVRITQAGNLQLSQPGTQLSFLGTTTGVSTFQAGAQGATNLNYTLPIAAPSANSLLYSSGGATSNLNWSNTGSNGQILTITGGVVSWQNTSALTGFMFYDVTTAQNTAATRTDNLFNVAYAAGSNDANAAGAVITSTGGATNRAATGLTVTSTATGTGIATGLSVTATGGSSNIALAATGNVNLLSAGGAASSLSLQNPAGSFATSFVAGAQAANINYTLPTAAAAANGYVLSSTTGGAMSWIDPTTLSSSDWHILGNAGTTAWNGATGNFLGTTDAQPTVIATTNTVTPQPIEFFTNTTEKMRLSAAGNLGLNQTNPSQLLDVRNGNILLSNSGSADQLQFQGTSTGISTFQAGAQGATNLNYTLPIAAPSANSLLYSSGGAASNLNWSNTGTNGQILTVTGGIVSWQNSNTLTGFVLYDVTTPQNASITRTDNLFNVAYGAGGNDANAAGAVITSVGGATNRTATGLTVTSTATGTGTSTALAATATGGASQTAIAATGNINILSAGGISNNLSFQNPAATFATTFTAGAQAANIAYTLPTAAAAVNGYVLSSTTGGAMSWVDATTLTNDWHLIGNATATAWNGAAGSFLGTTTTQPLVIATTNTVTPQPIEFFTNNAEKMRLSATGNLGINQTNPSQMLEVKNGNFFLSNTGAADQLQFQGTSTGISTFQAGAQGATNLNYTLPIAAPSANSLLYSSGGAVNNLNWSNTGTNGQILTVTGGVVSWQNANTLTGFVLYDITTPQNASVTRTDYLYNVAYGAGGNDANAAGAVITSVGGATNRTATGLTVTSTATGTGTSTGLAVTASGGTTRTAIAATGNVNLLSAGGVASGLSFQNPAGTFASTFTAGAQAANINYTLPLAVAASNGYVLSSTSAGVLSWTDPTTILGSDWHLTGNTGTTAWNGAAGNFLGTTDAQPLVLATTFTTTPQPIEFFTNNTEKMRLTSAGNLGINQTNPSQMLEVKNGNFLLSNTGAADQLQFQGTSTGISTFQAGAQGATNLNYTLPIAAPSANSLLYSSGGAASNLNWSNTGTNGQILTVTGGVVSWQNSNTLTGFVLYDVTTPQNASVTRTDNLFNVAYGAGGNDANAAGAVITSVSGATNRTATGLTVTSTATGTGTSTALSATATGGSSQTALAATGNVNLLSAGGVASTLSLQNPAGTFASSFVSGAQAANFAYTLPIAAPAANSLLYSSGGANNNLGWSNTGTNGQILTITGGVPSWQNTSTLTGFVLYDITTPQNASVTRTDYLYNVAYGAGGNDANAAGAVITSVGGATNRSATGLSVTTTATGTGTSTGLSVTASGGTSNYAALFNGGNVGIGQAAPTQLLEVKSGNVLLSNAGTADQLQFQGTTTGLTTLQAGAQGATTYNLTLPITTPAVNQVLGVSAVSGAGPFGVTLAWQNAAAGGSFVNYNTPSVQNTAVISSPNYLFNVAYAASASANNALGASISSVSGTSAATSATGLAVSATANGAGTSTALTVTAGGGTTNYAALFNGGNVGIGNANPATGLDISTDFATRELNYTAVNFNGSYNDLNFDGLGNKTSFVRLASATAASTFTGIAGGQNGKLLTIYNATAQNISLANQSASSVAANRIISGTGSTVVIPAGGSANLTYSPTDSRWFVNSINDLTTLNNSYWSLIGNSGTTAWNGTTGNFLGTTDAQPLVVGTTFTTTPQPVEFYTNNLERMRILSGGNVGINQTNPTQLLEVKSGNLLLSNAGTADQLQFQGTTTGLSTFQAGAQGATTFNYTWPITAPTANQVLTATGVAGVGPVAVTLGWANSGGGGSFVNYNTPSVQNTAVITSPNYLFNVAYAASATTNNALGAVISSVAGTLTNSNATGLAVTATAHGTGTSNGLNVTVGGGSTNYAATFQGGNVGFGNAAPNTDVDITGDIATREFNYVTSVTGTKNDMNFDGLAPANQMSFVRIATATGPFTITGVAGGVNGKYITIYNGTTQSMTVANQNASSVAANRIITGTQVNIPVPTGGSADLIYSATESRWVVHATSGVSGWLYTGNSGLTDGVNNFHGTLDNTPIRFVAGATGAPSTKMVLDINGNLLFGSNSGNATFTQGSGRVAFGDSVTTTRLASVPTYVNRVFNMIDPNAVVRIWRFNSNSGGTDPAIELVGGTNDNQGNSANHWWDVYATGTPGVAGSGTGGQGEHMSFRRRTGAHDSEYLAIFAGGNVGIGNNGVNPVETPDTRLVVRQVDGATNTVSDLVALRHTSTSTPTAGFGGALVFKAEDSTQPNQLISRISGLWTNVNHNNRTGALAFSTVNAGTTGEAVRISGNGNVGIGTTTPQVSMDINGGLATEATNVSLSNGNNNNVANLGNVSFARITGPTAAFTVTGIAGGSNGQILRLVNTTSQNFTLSHLNASSTAGNRIYSSTGADVTLTGQNSTAELIYDATNTQWVVTNSNSNSLSGPIGTIAFSTKNADQSVTNSTALVNDNNISFNVNDNETWEIRAELHADNIASGANLKFAFTVPAGAALKIYYDAVEDGGVSAGSSILIASGVAKTVTIVGGTSTYVRINGLVRVAGTAGVVQMKWAQGTANANATILRTDSYIKATRVN